MSKLTIEKNYHVSWEDRFLLEKISWDVEVKGDSEEEVIAASERLYGILDKIYFNRHPHMKPKQVESNTPAPHVNDRTIELIESAPKPLTKQEKEDKANQAIITEINNCTSEKMLSAYKLISANKPALKEAYDNQLKKLNNG